MSYEKEPMTESDPWKHRSSGMRCSTCIWFVPKFGDAPVKPENHKIVGRCRRHAPHHERLPRRLHERLVRRPPTGREQSLKGTTVNIPETKPQRTAVSLNDIHAKVKKTTYTVLPDTTTTVCQLHMENGFVILGTSGCVDPAKFNKALGEKYAYEKAIDKAWELEGYLLAEEIFRRKPVPRTYSWNEVATHSQLQDPLTGSTQFHVRMCDGTVFRGEIAFDHTDNEYSVEKKIIRNVNKQLLDGAAA